MAIYGNYGGNYGDSLLISKQVALFARLAGAVPVLTALCKGADVVPGQERIRIDPVLPR